MRSRALFSRASRPTLIAAAAGLALSACNQATPANNTLAAANAIAPAPLAALPLAMNAVAPTIAPAPVATALPAAPHAGVGRLADPREAYAFADRAAR
jgi:hypothetical protein